jgi:hypothetical protein
LPGHATGELQAPTISQFFGIVIQMFWREHAPPHFHALYGEYEALIDIRADNTGQTTVFRALEASSPLLSDFNDGKAVFKSGAEFAEHT